MIQSLLFAFITYIGWGSGDIFGAIASRKISAYSTAFWVYILGISINTLYIPFVLNQFSNFNPGVFLLNIFCWFLIV